MKRVVFLLFFIVHLCKTNAQDIQVQVPAFQAGEELRYKLKYGIFTAAETTIDVLNSPRHFEGQPAYHIQADSKTAGTFDVFYKVRNRYETYVDQKTLLPYFYTENRKESNYRHVDNVTFDHINHQITAAKGSFPFQGKVFDFLSAYYFSRSIDVSKLHSGSKFVLHYFLEDGIHDLEITYVGTEKASCSLGTFNCLKFSPTIIPGRIFRKDSKLYLWITNDGNRIPVRAQVELIVGSVTMDLAAAKSLKFPLNPLKK